MKFIKECGKEFNLVCDCGSEEFRRDYSIHKQGIHDVNRYVCTSCNEGYRLGKNYKEKTLDLVCNVILKKNFGENIYARWAGDDEGNEYVCVVFNDKLSIYINVEIIDGKYKVIGRSGDEIAGGSWYDLEDEEVQKYSKQIEELLNK